MPTKKSREMAADVTHHEPVDRGEALARMRDAAALWSVNYVTAAEVVDAACDLLVAGYDGFTLAMLAGVHARNAEEEVPELLEPALRDVGLDYYPRNSHPGQEAAVQTLAGRVVAGTLPPMNLAIWAHATIGHGVLDLAERLVELDDAYDSLEVSDMTEQDVDQQIIAEAHRITGSEETRSHELAATERIV